MPDITEIRYYSMEHADEQGKACHPEGTGHHKATDSIWLSQHCRETVRNSLLSGKTHEQIISGVQTEIVLETSRQLQLDDKAARSYIESQPVLPRDWLLSKLDIWNMAKKVTETT